LTRITAQLEELSTTVTSLKLYARLARLALMVVVGEAAEAEPLLLTELDERPPRSFIGWASVHGFLARGCNERGDYAAAKNVCERALVHITDADREYVSLFLSLDIQMAVAEAGLGRVDAALARIDAQLERFRESDHPLVQGFLHEARARIAWMAGLTEEYDLSLTIVEHWFRRTGTPALIAKCERLAELRTGSGGAHSLQGGAFISSKSNAVTGIERGRLEPEAQTVQASVRRRPETT
jgi:ATP/maltotriose-dependent transcriptional regulator MalT